MILMSTVLIIANVLSFIGNLFFCSSALLKRKRQIIIFQTTNHFLSSIAQFLQGAYSGMIQDFLCLVKNLVLLFVKESKKTLRLVVNVIVIVACLILGILINILLSDGVWYGYLPVFSNVIYGIVILLVFLKGFKKDTVELMIKSTLILNAICWGTYGIFVKLYTITIFNGITLIISIISIIIILVRKVRNRTDNRENIDSLNQEV